MDEHRMAEMIVKRVIEMSGKREVDEIIVNVGEVSGANYNRLFQMIKSVSFGTSAENARVRFNHIPLAVRCACGYEGEAQKLGLTEQPIVECPSCEKSLTAEVLRGRGVSLRDISFI